MACKTNELLKKKFYEIILKNPDKPWDWKSLSYNQEKITLDLVLKLPHKPWSWNDLSWNPFITLDFINQISSNKNIKPNWNWTGISQSSKITFDDVLQNMDKPWDFKLLNANPNLTLEGILKIMSNFTKTQQKKIFDWNFISANQNLDFNDVLQNLDLPWVKSELARNMNLKIEHLRKFEKDYFKNYWFEISKNSGISMDDIDNNMDLPWNFEGISEHYHLTLDFVKKYIDKPWNFSKLCEDGVFMDDYYKIQEQCEKKKD